MSVSVFFFSSRRRHTRFDCDWSSDVCSSDLGGCGAGQARVKTAPRARPSKSGDDVATLAISLMRTSPSLIWPAMANAMAMRSEERRVGEEGRSRGAPDHLKKKKGTERSVESS